MADNTLDLSVFKYTRGTKRRKDGTKRIPEGYIYSGTKPFQYTDQRGKPRTIAPGAHVSSRQFQNLRYQAFGWKSKSQYELVRDLARRDHPAELFRKRGYSHEASAYRRFAREYAHTHHLDIQKVLRPDSDFARLYTAALQNNFQDHGPNSPFAKLLVGAGLRDEGAEWDVGDTNPT